MARTLRRIAGAFDPQLLADRLGAGQQRAVVGRRLRAGPGGRGWWCDAEADQQRQQDADQQQAAQGSGAQAHALAPSADSPVSRSVTSRCTPVDASRFAAGRPPPRSYRAARPPGNTGPTARSFATAGRAREQGAQHRGLARARSIGAPFRHTAPLAASRLSPANGMGAPGRGWRGCTAARQRADACFQFVEVEGLGQVVVGAAVQAEDAVTHRAARGEDQHRRAQASAPPASAPAGRRGRAG